MGSGIHGGFGKTKGKRDSYTIHKGRQDKHIVGSNNYKQQIARGKHPSILTEDSTKLLHEGMGKGRLTGMNKEIVDYGRVIGKVFVLETGKYYETTRATIHYDMRGYAHIVPAKPIGWK